MFRSSGAPSGSLCDPFTRLFGVLPVVTHKPVAPSGASAQHPSLRRCDKVTFFHAVFLRKAPNSQNTVAPFVLFRAIRWVVVRGHKVWSRRRIPRLFDIRIYPASLVTRPSDLRTHRTPARSPSLETRPPKPAPPDVKGRRDAVPRLGKDAKRTCFGRGFEHLAKPSSVRNYRPLIALPRNPPQCLCPNTFLKTRP